LPALKSATKQRDALYIGIDVGTGGCRALAIDDNDQIVAAAETGFSSARQQNNEHTQDPQDWWQGVIATLDQLCRQIDASRVAALAVDGTSATVLLTDASGNTLTPGIMYNDARAREAAVLISQTASADTAAQGATSSLAKLIWLSGQQIDANARYFLHQSDWISGRLTGRWGVTDYNNALKLGYDCALRCWPDWMQQLPIRHPWLPSVHAPGDTIGPLLPDIRHRFGFTEHLLVRFGTTDGVAAFMASGANRPGQGVTSLGSTMVLKMLCQQPLVSAAHGIYSHRLGSHWLAGGASNSGGAVLLQHFSLEEIERLTPMIDPETSGGLDFYPLPGTGERFPVNDPGMQPRMNPVPDDRTVLLQAMLEGMAQIEALGYRRLVELGAPALNQVLTSGGGARNVAWTRIRHRVLGVPVATAPSAQPAFGVARLARGEFTEKNKAATKAR
jgi:sugar (pentulose or hexulose) kinase